MKKHLITSIVILLISTFTVWGKRSNVKLFAELSTFLNINKGDVEGLAGTQLIQQHNRVGGGFGLGVRLPAPRHAYVQFSMGLRFTPQSLEIKQGDLSVSQQFTNNHYYIKCLLGYNLKLGSSSSLDLGLGFQNYYSFNRQNTGTHLHYRDYNDPATQEQGRYLSNIYSLQWGDNRTGEERALVPFVFNPVLHLGFTSTGVMPKGRALGIAFELSSKAGSADGTPYNNNQGYLHMLDEQRNIIATETYRDKYTAASITISLNLF